MQRARSVNRSLEPRRGATRHNRIRSPSRSTCEKSTPLSVVGAIPAPHTGRHRPRQCSGRAGPAAQRSRRRPVPAPQRHGLPTPQPHHMDGDGRPLSTVFQELFEGDLNHAMASADFRGPPQVYSTLTGTPDGHSR